MVDRSAHWCLQGYYYQFDKTILEILRQSDPTAKVTVEGIEDIDLTSPNGTVAIQCKYYAKQKFHKSTIREPISLMLADFVHRAEPIRYHLYAYFGESDGICTSFSVDELKSILTYRQKGVDKCFHKDNNINDQQLAAFIQAFTFTVGPDFDLQRNEILALLKNHYLCSDKEADCHYYNNALRVIYDKATNPDINERELTKDDFFYQIEDTAYLFGQWYLRLRGKSKYVKFVHDKLKKANVFQTQKQVLVYLPESICRAPTQDIPLGRVIQDIAQARFLPGKSLHDAKPWTFILGSENCAMEVKCYLLNQGIPFNDGYESIQFSPLLFKRQPFIYRKRTPKGKATDRIEHASYSLRIVAESTYFDHIHDLDRPDIFIDFSGDSQHPRLKSRDMATFSIANCEVEDLLSILS